MPPIILIVSVNLLMMLYKEYNKYRIEFECRTDNYDHMFQTYCAALFARPKS